MVKMFIFLLVAGGVRCSRFLAEMVDESGIVGGGDLGSEVKM